MRKIVQRRALHLSLSWLVIALGVPGCDSGPSAQAECTDHRGCRLGEICVDEECVPGCAPGASCPGGQRCEGSRCVPDTEDDGGVDADADEGTDASTDADVDADATADADADADADTDTDADVDADSDVDADVDADIDADVDVDVDADADADWATDRDADVDVDGDADWDSFADADMPVFSWTMCTDTRTVFPMGVLYDSGGPRGGYRDDESCTFLIAPTPAAPAVVLSVVMLDTEPSHDTLTIYDGDSIHSPVLATLSGTSPPPDPITATSGAMLVEFTSDDSTWQSGFELMWFAW